MKIQHSSDSSAAAVPVLVVRPLMQVREFSWALTTALIGLIALAHVMGTVFLFNGSVVDGITSFGMCFGAMIESPLV